MGKSPVQHNRESKDSSPTNGDSSGSSSIVIVLVLISVAVGLAVLLKNKISKNKNKNLSDLKKEDPIEPKPEEPVQETVPEDEAKDLESKFG